MNKEELGIIKEQLPREELVEHYKSISKLNKKYCNDNIELQQRIDKAIEYLKKQSGWNRISCYGIDGEDVFELFSILRGEDNE